MRVILTYQISVGVLYNIHAISTEKHVEGVECKNQQKWLLQKIGLHKKP
jgi:hypothetical protein